MDVAERGVGEIGVVLHEHAQRPAPQEAAPGAREAVVGEPAGRRRQQHAHRHPKGGLLVELAVERVAQRVGREHGHVGRVVGIGVALVRVPQAAQPAQRFRAVAAGAAERRVRVVGAVAVRVVPAVRREPVRAAALARHQPGDPPERLERLGRLERAVGEEAVEADFHAQHRPHEHHAERGELGPADAGAQRRRDRDERAEQRQQQRAQRGTALGGTHALALDDHRRSRAAHASRPASDRMWSVIAATVG